MKISDGWREREQTKRVRQTGRERKHRENKCERDRVKDGEQERENKWRERIRQDEKKEQ